MSCKSLWWCYGWKPARDCCLFCPNDIIPKLCLFKEKLIGANQIRETGLQGAFTVFRSISALTATPFLIYTAYEGTDILVPMVQVALFLFVVVLAVFAKVADMKTSIVVQRFSSQRCVRFSCYPTDALVISVPVHRQSLSGSLVD